jgi:hypothetical protein
MQASDVAALVARYARRFHEVVGYEHHVASPLGAWLLLALCGAATRGEERRQLEDVLGCDADGAASVAAGLLEAPHPAVAAAAAVWNKKGKGDPSWLAWLPPGVERGPIPSQEEADAWAREHTFGLIERFPLWGTSDYHVLLASALATKVSWDRPFDLAPGSALGPASPWGNQVEQVLASPTSGAHPAFIVGTAEAGDVAVHVGRARDGLAVVSVIAASDVPAVDVLSAGHRLATEVAHGRAVARRSLFELPLGDAPLWSVREEMSPQGAGEQCVAYLPAWEARSEHDLRDPLFGFGAAAAALGKEDPWEAAQATLARYTRVGFEAAAVTGFAMLVSARLPGLRRTAELRFGHPYAVIAVAASNADADSDSGGEWLDRWTGVPVFSAWVVEPGEA